MLVAPRVCSAREMVVREPARVLLRGYAAVPEVDLADPTTVSKKLVLRSRGDDEERRLPLPSRPSAVLPRGAQDAWRDCAGFEIDMDLADPQLSLQEGIWDLYLETAIGDEPPHRQRLAAERGGQSHHVHTSLRAPGDHRYLPYLTAKGNVSVMVRGLSGHVEVAEMWVRDDTLRVHGELIGVASGARSVAVRRRADGAAVEFDGEWSGERLKVMIDLRVLAARDLAASAPGQEEQDWDVTLAATGGTGIAFASYLDDVPQKQTIMIYPSRAVSAEAGVRLMQPCYTAHNTVAISSRKAAR